VTEHKTKINRTQSQQNVTEHNVKEQNKN